MAKTEKAKPAKQAKGKGEGKKGGNRLLAFIPLLFVAMTVLPLSMIALVGLIPTLVVLATDKSGARHMTATVGALNVAGVAAVALNLFKSGLYDFDYAIRLVTDPVNLAIMWGGAGVGTALFAFVPPMVAQALVVFSEIKIRKLKGHLADLVKMWGDEVKSE
jgi:hypothetical protein